MNWRGFYTLFAKEVWRFLKVTTQTVFAPVLTVLLYLLVFSSVLSEHVQVYPGVMYASFLIPGLIMMSIIQNAFANSSSSLFQSKMTGNLVFTLLAPLSDLEFFLAFVAASVIRGIVVGLGVLVAAMWFAPLPMHSFWILLGFTVLSSATLGALGVIAGLWAEKWDHVAVFQNFVILPLSFLSGVFYSVNNLPPFWQGLSHFNPFFYMIDGFRYGFFGVADSSLGLSFFVVSLSLAAVSALCLWLLRIGYHLRN